MIADLVTDANAARPVTAGGTGETTARLKDGTWRFQNTADTTKLLAFDLSGLTTATTRTLTAPDASGTVMLTSTGLTNAQALTGSVVASSTTSYATYGSITTTIPTDDTKPQITEGNPIFSVNFTPQTTTNKLRIRATVPCTGSGLINVIGALFVASGADAVQVDYNTIPAADYFHTLNLEYEFTPGVTSAVNVQVRCGPASGTMYINGTTTTRRFGGALAATLVIEEIKA